MEKKPLQSSPRPATDSTGIERLFDVQEVAEQWKVSPKSLHRWAREGRIPAVKFGRLWRFRKSAIDEYLNSRITS